MDAKAWDAEPFKTESEHDGIEWHEGKEVVRGRFLESIVELYRIRCISCFKNWKQLEQFLKNTVQLGAKRVGSRVVPKLQSTAMRVDDVIVACDDDLQSDVVVPDVRKDTQGQQVDALINTAVIRGIYLPEF